MRFLTEHGLIHKKLGVMHAHPVSISINIAYLPK